MEELDYDDVKVRLFSQCLAGEARRWFTNIVDQSIQNYRAFEDSFRDKWEYQKNPKMHLSQYHSMRRIESEFVQECFDRFVVRISPHYRGKNGSLLPIGNKGRFLPLENSKKQK